MMLEIEFSLSQINDVAQQIIKNLKYNCVLFVAEMGTGKTTLINTICKELKIKDHASSPTFSIVNEYQTKDEKTIFHFDLYRLKSIEEALDMGIEEYLYSNNLCFIEWPEKINVLLPNAYHTIKLELCSNGNRKLILTNHN